MARMLPLVVALALAACSKGTPASAEHGEQCHAGAHKPRQAQDQAAAAPTAKPVPAELPDPIARVNGETISKADFEKAVETVEANAGGPVPPDQRDRVYRGVLDQMIGYRLLIQETKTRKLAVPDAELDKRIGQIRSQFPSEEAFKQTLDAAEHDPRAAPRRRAQ